MVDLFCLLAAPGAGDELQGIKRGVMELADLVVVNKADGDLEPAARRAAADLTHALHLLRPVHPSWTPRVLLTSALEGSGLEEVWGAALEHHETLTATGELEQQRSEQLRRWLWSELREGLVERFVAGASAAVHAAEADVVAGRGPPHRRRRPPPRLTDHSGSRTRELSDASRIQNDLTPFW